MRLRITLRGLGGSTTPYAATISTLCDLTDSSVKHMTLQGANTIGQMAVAIAGTSLRMNRKYLSFSDEEPGFVSALSTGFRVIRRKPQWNSIFIFDGIGSVFSSVRLILKCMVDSLVSCGNSVESTIACWSLKSELSPLLGAISSTIVT